MQEWRDVHAQVLANSPFLERLRARDIEVLLMVDPIDEHVMQSLKARPMQ